MRSPQNYDTLVDYEKSHGSVSKTLDLYLTMENTTVLYLKNRTFVTIITMDHWFTLGKPMVLCGKVWHYIKNHRL